jgi:hypothetical protein
MINGFNLPITALLSISILGRKQYAHHIISMFIICASVMVISLSGLWRQGDGKTGYESTVKGIFFIVLS